MTNKGLIAKLAIIWAELLHVGGLAKTLFADLGHDLRNARSADDFVHGAQRAQTNLVGLFIGLMIAAIVVIEVFIPVVLDALANNEDIDGTTATILELLPMFAALMLLIALASPLMRRL